MSLVDQELTLSTMDVTSGSEAYTKMMDVTSGSRTCTSTMDVTSRSITYTKQDGCH